MQQQYLDLNTATFVGIDAHPTEHTALAINRFEEEKGRHTFDNTTDGIKGFLHWLAGIDNRANNILVGVEGSGGNGHALVSYLLKDYENVYEVNPLYTKQRRMLGTNGKKSDLVDAKLVAEVVIRNIQSFLNSHAQSVQQDCGAYERRSGTMTISSCKLHG